MSLRQQGKHSPPLGFGTATSAILLSTIDSRSVSVLHIQRAISLNDDVDVIVADAIAPASRLKASSPATRPYLYPRDGDWRFTQRVRTSAVPKVDAIRDQALSLGWREARLYQNRGRFRFPCGEDYGLVCFLDENKRIGEVTRQSIEIVGPTPQEYRLSFYNPEVDQPWMKKKTSKA